LLRTHPSAIQSIGILISHKQEGPFRLTGQSIGAYRNDAQNETAYREDPTHQKL
jgi:hypothetical protein